MPNSLTPNANTFHAPDPAAWRAWLEQNSAQQSEVWLIFYKGRAAPATITYEEALDEALCWGWIDSIIQKIDEERYARKFSRRKDWQTWSEVNRRKVRRLDGAGRIRPEVRARIPAEVFDESVAGPARAAPEVPGWLAEALQAHPAAWEAFLRLPASKRRIYLLWIGDARREETRQKRVAEAIQNLEEGRELGMK